MSRLSAEREQTIRWTLSSDDSDGLYLEEGRELLAELDAVRAELEQARKKRMIARSDLAGFKDLLEQARKERDGERGWRYQVVRDYERESEAKDEAESALAQARKHEAAATYDCYQMEAALAQARKERDEAMVLMAKAEQIYREEITASEAALAAAREALERIANLAVEAQGIGLERKIARKALSGGGGDPA